MLSKYNYKELRVIKDTNYISKNALNIIKPNDEGVGEFNNIYDWVQLIGLPKLQRTKSGGISLDRKHFRGRGYWAGATRTMIELLIIYNFKFYKIHFKARIGDKDGPIISGTTAFRTFVEELEKDGIDINELAIDNGVDVKLEIESPLIRLDRENIAFNTYENAHHIDFHSSHPAGMAKYYPQLRPTIERIYKMKEEAEKGSYERALYKAVLNETWGYLQANHIGAKWAHIARDAIHDTNERLLALASALRAANRKILAYNTDGIWYQGEEYHGEGEGPGLGEWGHDHRNCKIRFKSAGAYEFIEDGKYNPVIRGFTLMDKVKDRDTEWEWGDIFNAPEYGYYFDENKGVVKTLL